LIHRIFIIRYLNKWTTLESEAGMIVANPGLRLAARCRHAAAGMADVGAVSLRGRICGVSARGVEIVGLTQHLSLGDRVLLSTRGGAEVLGEIVAFRDERAIAMTFGGTEGLGPNGNAVAPLHTRLSGLAVCDEWSGRVVDPLGRPLDGLGGLPIGRQRRNLRALPPAATGRARLGGPLELGVKALNLFAPCLTGQRLGLFAGSGVGKSTLLAALARSVQCDITVLALIGERGREVREFLEDDLGEQGRARSVVVVATSDSGPLLRREAAYAAMTIAEHFRDAGKNVLLLMDSVTRFCLALREIALASGEPPATRGYPPSVFGDLPKLLERAGPGEERGSAGGMISAFFTVLVEGDDHDEPVADAVRGMLDGHVILDRRIADRGRYPAIDILRSLSRTAATCLDVRQTALARRARGLLSAHAEVADLVRLGAYRSGSDPGADEAIAVAPGIEAVLRQGRDERFSIADSFAALESAMGEA
jgi:flagellum-specific ATP synthase